MKHKEYWYKWYKYAKHTKAHLTQRKITLEWFGMKISDTPFFETTPCFTNPSLFMEKVWMPWLIVKQFLVVEIGHTWPKKNVKPFWHHIWQRVPKPLFYVDPPMLPNPPFSDFVHPKPPSAADSPPHNVFYAARCQVLKSGRHDMAFC